MRFERAAILWRLGLLQPETLAKAALRELEDGPHSFALVELGTERDLGVHEITRLVERAAQEIGVTLPTQTEAIRKIACEIAREIVAGETTPHSSAKRLAKLYYAARDPDQRLDALLFFTGCDECVLPAEIVKDAKALLAKWSLGQ